MVYSVRPSEEFNDRAAMPGPDVPEAVGAPEESSPADEAAAAASGAETGRALDAALPGSLAATDAGHEKNPDGEEPEDESDRSFGALDAFMDRFVSATGAKPAMPPQTSAFTAAFQGAAAAGPQQNAAASAPAIKPTPAMTRAAQTAEKAPVGNELKTGAATTAGQRAPTDVKKDAAARMDIAQKAINDFKKQATTARQQAAAPNPAEKTAEGPARNTTAVAPTAGTIAGGMGSLVTSNIAGNTLAAPLPSAAGGRRGAAASAYVPAPEPVSIMQPSAPAPSGIQVNRAMASGPGFGSAGKFDPGRAETASLSLQGISTIGGQNPKAFETVLREMKADAKAALGIHEFRVEKGVAADGGTAGGAGANHKLSERQKLALTSESREEEPDTPQSRKTAARLNGAMI